MRAACGRERGGSGQGTRRHVGAEECAHGGRADGCGSEGKAGAAQV